MARPLRWYVVKTSGRRLPQDDDEGERIAAGMQEQFAKLHPEGLEGKRVIFKWDKGKLWSACIPMDGARNLTIH
jgi:hypothetical protein